MLSYLFLAGFLVSAMGADDFGFDAADTNHDGVISVDEQWARAMAIDTNGDGKISSDEYVKTYANGTAAWKAAAPKLFKELDVDNSSFIEKSDVVTGFTRIDTSGDAKVQKSEYVAFFTQLAARHGIIQSSQELDFGFAHTDTNHDGVISVDEQWVQALILDTNGDGKLSLDEYVNSYANGSTAIRAAAPQLFQVFDVDNSSFIEKSDVVTGFASIDASGDGKVQKSEYVAFFKQLFASYGIVVNPPNLSDYGFSAMDTNHDGQVTFEEQWAAIIILDTNGDNRVSQAEYMKSLPPQVASLGGKIFQKFDSDSNGFFEKVDIRRFSALVDTNGDGTMSSAEYTSFVETLLTSFGVDLSAFTTPRPIPAS